MKKIVLMLLFACSSFISVNAEVSSPAPREPEHVIAMLKSMSYKFMIAGTDILYSKTDPETGKIESKVHGCQFECNANDEMLPLIRANFLKDEDCGYQMVHENPNSGTLYQATVGENIYYVRNNKSEEFWMLCVKNADDPRLRDLYSISWSKPIDGHNKVRGSIFQITSLRPDLNEQSMSKRFALEVDVDEDIADSLYNIYIAPWGEEITEEPIATVPVINKKAHFSMNLDDTMKGRLRCIFPNGELCSAWIDVNFIPGMTLKLRVHNGTFDILNSNEYNSKLAQVRSSKSKWYKASKFDINKPVDTLTNLQNLIEGSIRIGDVKPDVFKRREVEAIAKEADILANNQKYLYEQINELRKINSYQSDYKEAKKTMKELYKQVRDINDRLNELTNKMVNVLNDF